MEDMLHVWQRRSQGAGRDRITSAMRADDRQHRGDAGPGFELFVRNVAVWQSVEDVMEQKSEREGPPR